MNSELNPVNRKTGKLIAKNIVILTVLVTVCALSIWAWFTKSTTATADGINVIAKAEGVEVSWDGKDYFYDLTAKDESEFQSGITGYAKNLCDENGNPFGLQLVSGNGLDFFEPYVNRRTGRPLEVSEGIWQGVDVVHGVNSYGKYIDLDLYFKGSNESNIYLAGDSSVNPKDPTTNGPNQSAYGNFSKDNIASASRVAFLNVEKDPNNNDAETITDCSFIWAPNADVKLEGNSNGYNRVKDTITEKGGVSSDKIPEEMLHTYSGDYYIWIPDKYVRDQITQFSSVTPYKMEFVVFDESTGKGLYVFDNYILNDDGETYTPTPDIALPGRSSMDIPFIISKSGTKLSSSDADNVNISNSSNAKDHGDITQPHIEIPNSSYNFSINGTSTNVGKITFSSYQDDHIRLVIGYNPDNTSASGNYKRAAVVLGYNSTMHDKEYDRIGYFDDNKADITYYELKNTTTNVALVSPMTSIAISSDAHNKKAVTFSDFPTNDNVTSLSVTLAEQFTATKKGSGFEATYTFQNKATGEFINITNGKFALSNIASEFSLYYKEGFTGPLLKSGNYILAIVKNEVTVVLEKDLVLDYAITVYEGTEYKIVKGSEIHKYYNNIGDKKGLVTLNTASTPPLYTSNQGSTNEAELGPCIATLTEENDFKTHIVVRIWVEGTDNEAQTPLADGIFDIALHFTTKFLNTP